MNSGYLAVSGGHEIYFEEWGNPDGKPVLCLHGGPGAGIDPSDRGFFDLTDYRVVLFDQRGCGKSRPFASIEHNTTWDLVADIEALRNHLEIDRWLVFGGSWGAALALAYAQTHPEAVRAMLLRGIFLVRPEELAWMYGAAGAHAIFPEEWARFTSVIPEAERGDLVRAYADRLPEAAAAWARWEASTCSLVPSAPVQAFFEDPARALALARIETHYFLHDAWLTRPLLANIDEIRHIPTILVQGRYDVVCPPKSAWDLHAAWPESQLVLVEAAGHIAQDPAIAAALRAALNRL